MFCKHNYVYTQGHFYCTKCHHRKYREKHGKRKGRKKTIAIASVIAIFLIGFILFENYNVTIGDQKIEDMIPLKTIEQTFDEVYNSAPVESIESAVQELSDSIPIKIEAKPETLEDKLLDCSIYKKNYLESNKNTRTTPDNMAAMMGEALDSVGKTRACEEYNAKLLTEAGVLGHCKPPPIGPDLLAKEDEWGMSYKERFIKYCGQEEWNYRNPP